MPGRESSIADALRCYGIPRRKFLKFCGSMATVLGLPLGAAAQVAATLEKKRRPVLVWLELQDCAGNSESILRSSHPSITELVLSFFSWEYHETIMTAAGKQANGILERVVHEEAGKYLAIVEGSIPTANPGYCTIGGRSALDIAKQVCGSAAAVIAVGSCAFDGGPQRSAPNPTGAIGVGEAVPNLNLVNMGGCPHNPANTAALLVYWLTYGRMPALDAHKRPLFAYGHIIHDQCERRANFDAGRFVERWDDDGARRGYCLYKMGCKGPQGNLQLPGGSVERWNQLAGRIRARLCRLRLLPFLGHGASALSAPAGGSRFRRGYHRREDRRLDDGRRCGRSGVARHRQCGARADAPARRGAKRRADRDRPAKRSGGARRAARETVSRRSSDEHRTCRKSGVQIWRVLSLIR